MAAVSVSHAQFCATAAGVILTILWIPGAPRYLHTLGLHLSTALIPHYLQVLHTTRQGSEWAVYDPQEFPILSPAPGRILGQMSTQLSLPIRRLCCVRYRDQRSLCKAEESLYSKD